MPRRWLWVVPVLAALAAAGGAWLDPSPALAAASAALVATAVVAVLGWRAKRRLERLATQLDRVARGELEDPPLEGYALEWQALGRSLEAVGVSMRARLDEIASERARVVRLLEKLPPAILLFDGSTLAYANAAARAWFDLPTRAVGQRIAEVLESDDLAKVVARARETDSEVEIEIEHGGRTLDASAAPTTEGEVALVVTDLTETRRVEAIRRDFVANASHELKTPVAGLQALSESLGLAMERDPDRAHRMIERMQHETSRLATMTRDLLDLARLEEITSERTTQRTDLAEIVDGQVRRLLPLCRERDVRIETDLPTGGDVDAAPEDLRLIAANLLENAIRYNREGGWVAVAVRSGDDEVGLEVADSGIGIPDSDQDRVFERFYRIDKGRSRAQGGTGLGLSLVRNAVQRYGGTVRLRSTPGEGSTFTVTLPPASDR
ncbi:hypothetical protein ER308_17365 [Egibacter rhizosphaerae]|uniref:Sensor-like histidine kinase SenX3 n=1 Tax=Egibacter rhizosphaerae TaxID=1670831 RepID=A0A411YJB7_9ACTN|nr:HAMP domain-containing sensor histidine kinase [Egibacter rhizosphaerae]QBI21166.1 hypothetical protein ER308_17365 [Egibacter rhizosphaerae]